jgi:hypothetical protein
VELYLEAGETLGQPAQLAPHLLQPALQLRPLPAARLLTPLQRPDRLTAQLQLAVQLLDLPDVLEAELLQEPGAQAHVPLQRLDPVGQLLPRGLTARWLTASTRSIAVLSTADHCWAIRPDDSCHSHGLFFIAGDDFVAACIAITPAHSILIAALALLTALGGCGIRKVAGQRTDCWWCAVISSKGSATTTEVQLRRRSVACLLAGLLGKGGQFIARAGQQAPTARQALVEEGGGGATVVVVVVDGGLAADVCDQHKVGGGVGPGHRGQVQLYAQDIAECCQRKTYHENQDWIRIQSVQRIWIQEGKNDHQKKNFFEMSCFEVLDCLLSELKASFATWMSFMEA